MVYSGVDAEARVAIGSGSCCQHILMLSLSKVVGRVSDDDSNKPRSWIGTYNGGCV